MVIEKFKIIRMKKDLVLLPAILVILSGVLPIIIFLLTANALSPGEIIIPQRQVSLFDQAALLGAIFFIKPVYMILALAAIFLFGQHMPKALIFSLISFLVGETACAVNIIFFFYESVGLEYLHSYFMVVCLGFLVFAAIEVVDHNFLHFSDLNAKCALVGTCRRCSKFSEGPCILRRYFQWAIGLTALIAFMPLMALPRPISYNVSVFGFLRNLSHPLQIQIFEIRYSPLAGLVLLIISWFFLTVRGHTQNGILKSKIFLASSAGFLAFSFMRLAFFTFYWDNLVWFVFWEELTELILVVGIMLSVWLFKPALVQSIRNEVSFS
jgi:hypothetical protein